MQQKGFTIIEVIIAMTIFLFTIGVVITIFISVIANQRGILAQQKAFNQLSYIQEYMSKALRMAKVDKDGSCLQDSGGGTGYVYLLTKPDITTGLYQGIKFINQSDVGQSGGGACTEFYLDTSGATPILKEVKDGNAAVALSSDQLLINRIEFAINGVLAKNTNFPTTEGMFGASDQDGVQPRLTILFDTDIGSGTQAPEKFFQTTISERNLNVLP